MAKSTSIRESEIKNRLRSDYFSEYDWTRAVGDIDLTVCSKTDLGAPVTFLWAETKKGTREDIYESLIQLILTVGKARTFETELPPYFIGAADAEKIAFVEFSHIMPTLTKTDFNWNVTPSDHGSKEFKELYELLHTELASEVVIFKYTFDDKTLRQFIRKNFVEGRTDVARIPVNKNNFTFVYYDWVKNVKDSILMDWKALEKQGVLDCDFFLADLMSVDDMSIRDRLKVILEKTKYKILQKMDFDGMFNTFTEIPFRDKMVAYRQFWNRYERPPKPVYQKYILERRDLLVPQNIREVKGSYYTPQVWVRLAQEYLAKTLGEDWQDEYYVWDCAAGSGNLLRGLTNRFNIFASTLDDADVQIMHNAIDEGRLNLVKQNVFQFDFLNDEWDKLPESLRNIVTDPEKRKKLVVFINAPYKEATNAKTITGTGKHSIGSTSNNKTWARYKEEIGPAVNELFVQFTCRIAREIAGCVLAEFSTLKIMQAPNFKVIRQNFGLELKSLFIVPGDTFDNVKGQFPIGFQIFNTGGIFKENDSFAFVYTKTNSNEPKYIGKKIITAYEGHKLIATWIKNLNKKKENFLSFIRHNSSDFQQQNRIILVQEYNGSDGHYKPFSKGETLKVCTYHAVRKIPQATWLNDRDQFLAPKDTWSVDLEFQTDCLIWSIFNNAVREENGVCHWIPFYEDEVNSVGTFNSRFMANFLHGKVKRAPVESVQGDLWSESEAKAVAEKAPLEAISPEAWAVLDAGKAIWRYYMSQPGARPNASFLDIRARFQGYKTDKRGKKVMNSDSTDPEYSSLLKGFRSKVKALEKHIEPKIYEHGFLL